MGVAINELGEKYGMLTVISPAGKDKHGKLRWLVRCECGNSCVVCGGDLRFGKRVSCGCIKIKHGLRNHVLYGVWRNIISRCYNKKSDSYPYYGGRGIGVCDEWRSSPTVFIAWAMRLGLSKGLQVDRINNNEGYSPRNCRIVLPVVNSHNCRARHNEWRYTGVHFKKGRFVAQIHSIYLVPNKKHLGTYDSPEAAVVARNAFIKDNGLPHTIQELRRTSDARSRP